MSTEASHEADDQQIELGNTVTEENTNFHKADYNKSFQQLLDDITSKNDKKLLTLENSFKESISVLENSFKESISVLKQQFDKHQVESTVEKDFIKKLQADMTQMQEELKSRYGSNEVENYKSQIEIERKKVAKTQETLMQVSAEKEEKVRELSALKENHQKLEKSYEELLCEKQKKENESKEVLETFQAEGI